MNPLALLSGRWTLIASGLVAVLIPLTIWTAYGWGVAHHDRVREIGRANELDLQINTPATGFRDRLAACQVSRIGLEAGITEQNRAVQEMSEQAARLEADAARRIAAAQDKARQAERRSQSILTRQPAAGVDRCQAADDLILEVIK